MISNIFGTYRAVSLRRTGFAALLSGKDRKCRGGVNEPQMVLAAWHSSLHLTVTASNQNPSSQTITASPTSKDDRGLKQRCHRVALVFQHVVAFLPCPGMDSRDQISGDAGLYEGLQPPNGRFLTRTFPLIQ